MGFVGDDSSGRYLSRRNLLERNKRKLFEPENFRVFGSAAFLLIPKHYQQGLKSLLRKKSEPCILLGYMENMKAYRLMKLSDGKIIEDAFILAAIERAKDRLAALQVLTVENGQRIPVQLFRAFEHRRKSRRRLFELIRRFRLNRRETVARDAINILGADRDSSGLDLICRAGIFMMLGDAGS